MIITLVIRSCIIALDLINEHKTEAKWFAGWPCAHNGVPSILGTILSMNKQKAPFQLMVISFINGSF